MDDNNVEPLCNKKDVKSSVPYIRKKDGILYIVKYKLPQEVVCLPPSDNSVIIDNTLRQTCTEGVAYCMEKREDVQITYRRVSGDRNQEITETYPLQLSCICMKTESVRRR